MGLYGDCKTRLARLHFKCNKTV
eukprot:SAG11_NODE_18059_length_501_cov_0.733831_1_plen_22_part_10